MWCRKVNTFDNFVVTVAKHVNGSWIYQDIFEGDHGGRGHRHHSVDLTTDSAGNLWLAFSYGENVPGFDAEYTIKVFRQNAGTSTWTETSSQVTLYDDMKCTVNSSDDALVFDAVQWARNVPGNTFNAGNPVLFRYVNSENRIQAQNEPEFVKITYLPTPTQTFANGGIVFREYELATTPGAVWQRILPAPVVNEPSGGKVLALLSGGSNPRMHLTMLQGLPNGVFIGYHKTGLSSLDPLVLDSAPYLDTTFSGTYSLAIRPNQQPALVWQSPSGVNKLQTYNGTSWTTFDVANTTGLVPHDAFYPSGSTMPRIVLTGNQNSVAASLNGATEYVVSPNVSNTFNPVAPRIVKHASANAVAIGAPDGTGKIRVYLEP